MRDLASTPTFQLRSLVGPVYLPNFLYSAGTGLVLPVMPLFAQELGAGLGTIGLIVTLGGLGQMLLSVPAGVFADRYGVRATMGWGMVATAFVAALLGLSTGVPMFAVLTFVGGAVQAIFNVARLVYVARVVPIEQRGRAISLVGGTSRIGVFVGPAVGGFLAHAFGLQVAFFAQAIVTAAAAVALFALAEAPAPAAERASRGGGAYGRVGRTLANHRREFLTVGSVAFAIVLMRHARQVLMPLWGDAIGLNVSQIGVVLSVGSALDASMFYPVGVVMDRFGRKFAVIPSLVLLAASLVLMPFALSYQSFLLLGLLSGFGNGFGSGVVMTLGADLAPADRAGEFIGVWRLVADVGGAVAPLGVGALAEVATLGTSAVASGLIGLAGVGVMLFLVEETLHRGRPPALPRAP
jgi:MFS family permease